MLQPPDREGPLADRHLDAVLGFESFLPEGIDGDDQRGGYRLTMVYFSGEPSRGDIHLRAYIQDVLPSTVCQLRDLARQSRADALGLLRVLVPQPSEAQVGYLGTRYRSVPYLLARAYGGSHLWAQLERALHRRPLDLGRLTANAAARMASLVPRWPDSGPDLRDEVIFYLTCRDFVDRYNRDLARGPREEPMPMRPWRDFLSAVERGPITELNYSGASELGFACGALIRCFSRRYWSATKVGTKGKDYLKHRVLTFGADLTPEAVYKQALKGTFEVAAKIQKVRFGRDLRERVGHALTEYARLREEVQAHRDDFMTAFWAGYALQGYDRPRKKAGASGPEPTTAGAQA
jgi:hypothetical protein